MYDVITFGSATVDVFAQSESKLIKIFDAKGETDLLAFPTGSKLLIQKLRYTIGGGGTNSAVGFSKLGLRTAYIGKVGTGHNSELVIDSLRKYRVSTRYLKRGRGNCGYSIVLDNKEKDRVILAHKGLNDMLRPAEVRLKDLKTRWIYSSSLMGESLRTLEKVFSYTRKAGIKTAFNPSSYMVRRGIPYLKQILSHTDVLIFNEDESRTLIDVKDRIERFRRLHALGLEIVVITNGRQGVFVSDSQHIYTIKSRKVAVADSTGAGDCFSASFITGLIRQKGIEYALRMGIENALSVIQQIGAKEGLLDRKTLDSLLKTKKHAISKRKW